MTPFCSPLGVIVAFGGASLGVWTVKAIVAQLANGVDNPSSSVART